MCVNEFFDANMSRFATSFGQCLHLVQCSTQMRQPPLFPEAVVETVVSGTNGIQKPLFVGLLNADGYSFALDNSVLNVTPSRLVPWSVYRQSKFFGSVVGAKDDMLLKSGTSLMHMLHCYQADGLPPTKSNLPFQCPVRKPI